MKMKSSLFNPILSFWLIVSISCLLFFGDTPFWQLWHFHAPWNPLLHERIPRLIVLFSSGAALAVAGTISQSLFRNPLASPSVLGIPSGGILVVTILFALKWHDAAPFCIPLGAFFGAFCTLFFVYALSKKQGPMQMHSLILTGIATAALLLAIRSTITYALKNEWELIQTLTEWEAGMTTNRQWMHVHMQLPCTLVGLLGAWSYRQELNILALGDEEALTLGVNVSKVRFRLFMCIALLMGGTIAAVGIIAFFGLIMPHLMRNISGFNHDILIPRCILAGGTTFLFLDTILRLANIQFLSIGNISAILGGIFFLALLFYPAKRRLNQPC